jgi:hypothetical protein
MSDRQPNSGGNLVMPATAPAHERVSVRRRRSRRGHRSEQRGDRRVVRARTRWVRTLALCTGVLLLMALGLYFGLARQESAAPSDGAARGSPFRATALA